MANNFVKNLEVAIVIGILAHVLGADAPMLITFVLFGVVYNGLMVHRGESQ